MVNSRAATDFSSKGYLKFSANQNTDISPAHVSDSHQHACFWPPHLLLWFTSPRPSCAACSQEQYRILSSLATYVHTLLSERLVVSKLNNVTVFCHLNSHILTIKFAFVIEHHGWTWYTTSTEVYYLCIWPGHSELMLLQDGTSHQSPNLLLEEVSLWEIRAD